jgi:hypothetical protein
MRYRRCDGRARRHTRPLDARVHGVLYLDSARRPAGGRFDPGTHIDQIGDDRYKHLCCPGDPSVATTAQGTAVAVWLARPDPAAPTFTAPHQKQREIDPETPALPRECHAEPMLPLACGRGGPGFVRVLSPVVGRRRARSGEVRAQGLDRSAARAGDEDSLPVGSPDGVSPNQ